MPGRSATARSRRTATPTRSAFSLSAGGLEFLIDPGTYAYHTQERWRNYFRGTSAHNTVRLDALDQSVPGGNFMWLSKARAGCSLWLSSPEKDSFEGWHDGYMRLDDPVKHRRLIELDKRARRVLVEDTLEMGEEHDVELFFHCHEDCAVDAIAGGYLIVARGHFAAAAAAASRECGVIACTTAAWRRCSAGSRAPSTRAVRRRPSPGARGSRTARCCAPRS